MARTRAQLARARLTAAAVALVAPAALHAQAAARPDAFTRELRLDGAADSHPSLTVGGGVLADAGAYVRFGMLAGVGVAARDSRRGVAPAVEVAVVGRFLLDPFRQSARGVYAGGGLAVRAADSDGRPFVLLTLGVEGRARGGTAPAVEFGVGHGVRLAVALRRARPNRR